MDIICFELDHVLADPAAVYTCVYHCEQKSYVIEHSSKIKETITSRVQELMSVEAISICTCCNEINHYTFKHGICSCKTL